MTSFLCCKQQQRQKHRQHPHQSRENETTTTQQQQQQQPQFAQEKNANPSTICCMHMHIRLHFANDLISFFPPILACINGHFIYLLQPACLNNMLGSIIYFGL